MRRFRTLDSAGATLTEKLDGSDRVQFDQPRPFLSSSLVRISRQEVPFLMDIATIVWQLRRRGRGQQRKSTDAAIAALNRGLQGKRTTGNLSAAARQRIARMSVQVGHALKTVTVKLSERCRLQPERRSPRPSD